METTRRIKTFRLRSDLIERLQKNAKKENRTLNNYVESVLLDLVYREPNEVTKAAIEEATSGHNTNKVYTNVDEMMDERIWSAIVINLKGTRYTPFAELQAKPKEEKPRRRIGFIQNEK